MKIKLGFLVSGFGILLPAKSYAFDVEYRVYGGFEIYKAFEKAALIFSDVNYIGLAASAAIIAVVISSLSMVGQVFSGDNKAGLSPVAAPFLIGLALFSSMVANKGTITVYDEITGQSQAIPGVPDLITLIAGVTNKLEIAMVQMVVTASDPIPFDQYPPKKGFKLLHAIGGGKMSADDLMLDISLKSYINDCVWFEMVLPDTTLKMTTLKNDNIDLVAELEKANSPAIPVTYYDGSHQGGTLVTCKDAWDNIKPLLNNANTFSKSKKSACALAGYDPDNAADLARCTVDGSKFVSETMEPTANFDTLIKQAAIAKRLEDAAMGEDVTTISNYNAGQSYLGEGEAAVEWFPIIKVIMISIGIALTPFLCLFIPTVAAKKAIQAIVFLFLFPAVWGVVDAIISSFLVDYGIRVFQAVKVNRLGLDAIYMMENVAGKTLAVWSKAQGLIPLLAMGITGMFVQGGYAFASMAGGLSGSVSSQGADAMRKVGTPQGVASQVRAQGDVGSIAAAQNVGFGDRVKASTYEGIEAPTISNSRMGAYEDQFGADMGQMAKFRSDNRAVTEKVGIEGSSAGAAVMGSSASMVESVGAQSKIGSSQASIVSADARGHDSISTAAKSQSLSNQSDTLEDLGIGGGVMARMNRSIGMDGKSAQGTFTSDIRTPEQKQAVVDYLNKSGWIESAKAVEGMDIGPSGITMKGTFSEQNRERTISSFDQDQGAHATNTDIGSDLKKRLIDKKGAIRTGEEIDHSSSYKEGVTSSGGVKIEGAAYSALNGEVRFTKGLGAQSGTERSTDIMMRSGQLSKDLSNILKQEGTDLHEFTSKTGVSSGFLKAAGIDLSTDISWKSRSQDSYNLLTKAIDSNLSNSYAKIEKYNPNATAEQKDTYAAKELQKFMKADVVGDVNSQNHFGARSIDGGIADKINSSGTKELIADKTSDMKPDPFGKGHQSGYEGYQKGDYKNPSKSIENDGPVPGLAESIRKNKEAEANFDLNPLNIKK